MNRKRLEVEGEKWVKKDIISDDQLEKILDLYEKKDYSFLLIVLAALLISIGVLIFIFSDWAQIPHVIKIAMMVLIMIVLYSSGFYLRFSKQEHKRTASRRMLGISFIVIAYVMFGAILFLTLNMYNVITFSAWPFVVWSIIGLFLFLITPHSFLLATALLITIFGQWNHYIIAYSFNYILFFLLVVCYFYFVYRNKQAILHYLFAVGLAVQLMFFTLSTFEQFYWFILVSLTMYLFTFIIIRPDLRIRMEYITLLAIFVYKVVETLILQDRLYMDQLTLHPIFFILLSILFIVVAVLLWRKDQKQLFTLLLFLPLFIVPYAYLFIIISLFVYSVYVLIDGFVSTETNTLIFGIISFAFSTFIVFLQFEWDILYRAIFFVVAGIVLFVINIMFQKRRKQLRGEA